MTAQELRHLLMSANNGDAEQLHDLLIKTVDYCAGIEAELNNLIGHVDERIASLEHRLPVEQRTETTPHAS